MVILKYSFWYVKQKNNNKRIINHFLNNFAVVHVIIPALIMLLTTHGFFYIIPSMKINTKKIKDELSRIGICQAELARRMGITRQALHQQLNGGARSFATISKLSKALNLPERDLIK